MLTYAEVCWRMLTYADVYYLYLYHAIYYLSTTTLSTTTLKACRRRMRSHLISPSFRLRFRQLLELL